MLAITRKPGQMIKMTHQETGEVIWVKYIKQKGSSVCIGIQASDIWGVGRTDEVWVGKNCKVNLTEFKDGK